MSKVEVDKMLSLCKAKLSIGPRLKGQYGILTVSDKATKVPSYDAVPCWPFSFIKLLSRSVPCQRYARRDVGNRVSHTAFLMCCAISFSIVNFVIAS